MNSGKWEIDITGSGRYRVSRIFEGVGEVYKIFETREQAQAAIAALEGWESLGKINDWSEW